MSLTVQTVIDGVRSLHPAFHATRVPNPPLVQAVGFAVRALVDAGAKIDPTRFATTVALDVGLLVTTGAPVPDILTARGGTVGFTDNQMPAPVVLGQTPLPVGATFALTERGGLAFAVEPEGWASVSSCTLVIVPTPAMPTTLAEVLVLPESARWALVQRVAVTAATFAQADIGGTIGNKAAAAGLALPVFEAAAEAAERHWLDQLITRVPRTPFTVREG